MKIPLQAVRPTLTRCKMNMCHVYNKMFLPDQMYWKNALERNHLHRGCRVQRKHQYEVNLIIHFRWKRRKQREKRRWSTKQINWRVDNSTWRKGQKVKKYNDRETRNLMARWLFNLSFVFIPNSLFILACFSLYRSGTEWSIDFLSRLLDML